MRRHSTLVRVCLAFILITICLIAIFGASAPATEINTKNQPTAISQSKVNQ